ncbi:hypothetical protein [Mycobacterium riyadhense]|nr:hypothetical protein [Mycobacterium riyadhense]MCV7148042.1 hypothetical protein [Mycobacterium riyadhense]VTO96538.1 hypothetical protein BIN_B_01605 [Mycobacterium riyadhense]
MRITTFVAATAVFAGAGFCTTAPPVWAEVPAMDGVYTYADEDGIVATWTINTTCTPHCVAHVTTAPGQGFDAALVDGRYSVTRTVPEGALCPAFTAGANGASDEGGLHPVTVYQWWDPLTLSGEVDFLHSPAPCGLADRHDRFTLTKVG